MCRRNESAVIVKWSSSPRRSQAAARTSRVNTSCWVSVGVNAVKSWAPTIAAAAAWSRRVRAGAATRAPARRASGDRDGRGEDDVAVRAARRRESRVEAVRRLGGVEHGDVVRERGVERLGQPRERRAALSGEAHDLAGRMDAGVGAPGDREPVPARVRRRRAPRAAHAFDRPPARLARPAAKPGAVVLEREPQRLHGATTRARPRARGRRDRSRRPPPRLELRRGAASQTSPSSFTWPAERARGRRPPAARRASRRRRSRGGASTTRRRTPSRRRR